MAENHYTRDVIDFNEITGELYSFMEQVKLVPEYATMSRHPGIGSGWYEKYSSDCFPSDYLIKDGNKLPIPKYYLDRLEKEDNDEWMAVKEKRRIAAALLELENTDLRLQQKEAVKKAQHDNFKRNKL
mgnify:CR=1 FL=1